MPAQANTVLSPEPFVAAQAQRGKNASVRICQNDVGDDLLERGIQLGFAARHGLQIALDRVVNGLVGRGEPLRKHRRENVRVHTQDDGVAVFPLECLSGHVSLLLLKNLVSSIRKPFSTR